MSWRARFAAHLAATSVPTPTPTAREDWSGSFPRHLFPAVLAELPASPERVSSAYQPENTPSSTLDTTA